MTLDDFGPVAVVRNDNVSFKHRDIADLPNGTHLYPASCLQKLVDQCNAKDVEVDLRGLVIKDEQAVMFALANRIVRNANPEEDSRLNVAYAIARHLHLDWPSAHTVQQPVAVVCSYEGWEPSPENINALPEAVRKHIHNLETICDPAGLVSANYFLEESVSSLENLVVKQKIAESDLRKQLATLQTQNVLLQKQQLELLADSERLRWLSDNREFVLDFDQSPYEAIDAALSKAKEGE